MLSSVIVSVYLVKEAVDLCECVCKWQVEELGKVLQTQSLSLQLCGSSRELLQHLLCRFCSQSVNATGNIKRHSIYDIEIPLSPSLLLACTNPSQSIL